jgi:hypothetical protein
MLGYSWCNQKWNRHLVASNANIYLTSICRMKFHPYFGCHLKEWHCLFKVAHSLYHDLIYIYIYIYNQITYFHIDATIVFVNNHRLWGQSNNCPTLYCFIMLCCIVMHSQKIAKNMHLWKLCFQILVVCTHVFKKPKTCLYVIIHEWFHFQLKHTNHQVWVINYMITSINSLMISC